jgi:GNAT superfamily N-acetyltransferase
MRFQHDPWLAGVLGLPTFSVLEVSAAVDDVRASLAAHRSEHGGAFYFAKLAGLQVAEAGALTTAGFRLAETNLAFGRGTSPSLTVPGNAIQVEPARPHWREGVLQIAATAFRYSRFHADPRFTRAAADLVKRAWIESYFDGKRGHVLLVAIEHGSPVGFAAVLLADRDGRNAGVIDLIGVRTDRQAQGIGRHLLAAVLEECRPLADVVEVGTQATNVPSIRLYEGAGFRLVRSSLVLHLHPQDRPCA